MELSEFKKEVAEELMPKVKYFLQRGELETAYNSLKNKGDRRFFLTLVLHCFPKRLAEVALRIPANAFDGMPVPSHVILPEGIQSLGDASFHDCKGLLQIELPDSISSIGKFAFGWSMYLESVKLPANLKTVESCTFFNCDSLSQIDIPEGVTSIGAEAFRGCDNLYQITIPSTVTSIGKKAFACYYSVTPRKIKIPKSLYKQGCYAHWGVSKDEVEWY